MNVPQSFRELKAILWYFLCAPQFSSLNSFFFFFTSSTSPSFYLSLYLLLYLLLSPPPPSSALKISSMKTFWILQVRFNLNASLFILPYYSMNIFILALILMKISIYTCLWNTYCKLFEGNDHGHCWHILYVRHVNFWVSSAFPSSPPHFLPLPCLIFLLSLWLFYPCFLFRIAFVILVLFSDSTIMTKKNYLQYSCGFHFPCPLHCYPQVLRKYSWLSSSLPSIPIHFMIISEHLKGNWEFFLKKS